MKKVHLFSLFAAATLVSVPGASSPVGEQAEVAELMVEDVLARHVEAIGGGQAVDAIHNILVRSEIVEPSFTVRGDYRATRDGLMRVDVYAEGARVFSEGLDVRGGWQQAGEGEPFTETSEAAGAALAHGIEFNLFGLHDLAARGHQASLEGRSWVDGTHYYVVGVVLADGFRRDFYINPENWLIERHRETSALHPDLDSEERASETIESDFQRFCGLLRATQTSKVDLETGEEIQRTRALSVDCNVDQKMLAIARSDPASPPRS